MKSGPLRMFEVCVSTSFVATHAVTIQGVDETPHSHDWKVDVMLAGTTLDSDGLLIDFLEVEKQVEFIIAPLRDTDLNVNSALDGKNPSTEFVAQYIGDALRLQIRPPITVQSVSVTEAPNCKAIYTP